MKTKIRLLLVLLLVSSFGFAQYVNKISLKQVNLAGYTHLPKITVTSTWKYYYVTNVADTILVWNLDTTLTARKVVKKLVPPIINYKNEGQVKKFYPTINAHFDGTLMIFYRGYVHVYSSDFNYIKSIEMPILNQGEPSKIFISSYNVRNVWDYDSVMHVETDTVVEDNMRHDTRYGDYDSMKVRYMIYFKRDFKINYTNLVLGSNDFLSSPLMFSVCVNSDFSSEDDKQNFYAYNDTTYTMYQYKYRNGVQTYINPFRALGYPTEKKSRGGFPTMSKDYTKFCVITRYFDNTWNLCVVNRGWHVHKTAVINKNYYNDTLYGNAANNVVLFDVIPTPDNSFLLSYVHVHKLSGYEYDKRRCDMIWTTRKLTPEFFRDSISPKSPETPQFIKQSMLYIRSYVFSGYRNDSVPVSFKLRDSAYSEIPTIARSDYYYEYETLPYKKCDTVLLTKGKDSTTIILPKISYTTYKDTTIYNYIKVEVTKTKDTTINVNKKITVDSIKVVDKIVDTVIYANDTVKSDLGYIYLFDEAGKKVKVTYEGGLKFELIGLSGIEVLVNGIKAVVVDGQVVPVVSSVMSLQYNGKKVKYAIKK